MEVYDVDSEFVRLHSIEMPADELSPLSIRTYSGEYVYT